MHISAMPLDTLLLCLLDFRVEERVLVGMMIKFAFSLLFRVSEGELMNQTLDESFPTLLSCLIHFGEES